MGAPAFMAVAAVSTLGRRIRRAVGDGGDASEVERVGSDGGAEVDEDIVVGFVWIEVG
jgi:hypothetical protein